MPSWITIKQPVPPGYVIGDYAQLCWDAGTGTVDYDNPVTGEKLPLFPNRCGIHGYGRIPYGMGPYGHAVSIGTPGYARMPYGRAPYGHPTCLLQARTRVAACGTYKFAFAVFDAAGNPHAGSPGEVSVVVHTAPEKPVGLKKTSYNPATNLLVLAVNS